MNFMRFSRIVARAIRPVAFLFAAALSLQAQEVNDTKAESVAKAAIKANKPETVVPIESEIKFRSERFKFSQAVKLPENDFDSQAKNPFAAKDADEQEAEPEKTATAAGRFPSALKSNFSAAKQTSGGYIRPNAKARFKSYLSGVVGPYALLGTAAFAGVYHYRDLPREWENDSRGYARRFASGLGISAVRETTVYALGEAFRLDSNFYKSKRKKISERLIDAVVSTYTARRPDGSRVFAFPRIAGNYAAINVAYKTWYPNRFSYKNALRDATFSIGFDVGINIFREFFPWSK